MGQAELVEAAAQARTKATEAHAGLEQVRTSCQERVEALAALKAQLAADREALAAAMEELGQATGAAAQKLENAVNQAAMGTGAVDDASDQLALSGGLLLDAIGSDLDETTSALGQVTTSIAEAVRQMQELQHTAFEKVGHAAVAQLQRESDHAEALLGDQRRGRLERLTPALELLMDDALGLLETTLPLELEKAATVWSFRAEHTVERAAEAFDSMLEHAEEITAFCAIQLAQRLAAKGESLAGEAGRVAVDLQALATSLNERKATLDGALLALAEGFAAQQLQLQAIAAQLEETRFRWSTFGFAS